jgi:hypothetical protein
MVSLPTPKYVSHPNAAITSDVCRSTPVVSEEAHSNSVENEAPIGDRCPRAKAAIDQFDKCSWNEVLVCVPSWSSPYLAKAHSSRQRV